MSRPSLIVSAILALAVCLSVTGVARTQPKQPPPSKEPPSELDPADTPLRKLQRERFDSRSIALAKIETLIQIGRWAPQDFSSLMRLQTTLTENLAELMDKPAEKVQCYEMRLKTAKEFEQFIKTRVEAGTDPPQNLNVARAARIDTEIALLKLKCEPPPPEKKRDKDPELDPVIAKAIQELVQELGPVIAKRRTRSHRYAPSKTPEGTLF